MARGMGRLAIAMLVMVVSLGVGGVSPAGACTLQAPGVFPASSSVSPGQTLQVELLVYAVADPGSTTTTTTGQPPIADCPPIESAGSVVLRFVQGDVATDLVVLDDPPTTAFSETVTVPASATAGPARIVAASGGEPIAVSEVLDVVAAASPPAAPTPAEPTFTG